MHHSRQHNRDPVWIAAVLGKALTPGKKLRQDGDFNVRDPVYR
jgi:hypothetical protein